MARLAGSPSRLLLWVVLSLAILSVGLVVGVSYISFARATVAVFPREQPVSTEFSAPLSGSGDATSLEAVPGRVESVELSGTKEVASVGAKPVPDFAHVVVTIYNGQGANQGLLPRTQLVNEDGVKFRTDESVNVPAGGSVEVGATADAVGKEYNIGPSRFSIIKLSPELQQLVYAESTEAATGGEKTIAAVVEADIKAAVDAVKTELEQQAMTELEGRLNPNEILVREAAKTEVTKQESSVEPNTETDKFSVDVTIKTSVAIFDENSLLQLAIAKLSASLPAEQELASYDPATFTYKLAGLDQKKGTASVSGSLSGVSRMRLPERAFEREPLRGKTRAAVEGHYRQFTEVDHVDITFSPFWAFMIPSTVDKISIDLGKSPSVASQAPVAE